jgi:HAD superfamily hydrolase (TIGR01509 family)
MIGMTILQPQKKTIEIRGGIFDFDGLLGNTEKIHFKGWNSVLKGYGKRLPLQQYRPYCGKPTIDNARAIVEFFNLPILPEEMQRMKGEWHEKAVAMHGIAPMRGADEVTLFFKSNGVPLAIATGRTRCDNSPEFAGFPLMSRFSLIGTGDSVSRNKPYPDIFDYTCSGMGVAKENAIVFEDSEPGARAARDAGIGLVIGVPTIYAIRGDVEKVAHKTFGNLLSALAFIKKSLVQSAEGLLVLEFKA